MLCERCQKRPAAVHMTKIINGKKTETNLCEVCAHEENQVGMGAASNWMLQNIFAELFNQTLGKQQLSMDRSKPVKCEQCGFTDNDFSQVGKLGCPKCYEVFGSKLDPILRRIHGNPTHTGKIPVRTGGNLGLKRQIEELKQNLKDAVSREEYEKAAEIRDRLRDLENKMG